MKVLVSRINKGEVLVAKESAACVGQGIAAFVGIEKSDHVGILASMADKIISLRIFENDEGKMHYSVKDKNFSILSS